jgi:hypothetical protein
MLRFLPDSWLEGALRPLLLADPAVGLYYEEAAPDWRFLALLMLLGVAAATGRLRSHLTSEHGRMLLALFVAFYVWTFTAGNGRYFVTGLLIVGPVLVLAWQWLPGTRTFRWLVLGGFIAAQAWTVSSMYRPGAWALVKWKDGPALNIAATPLRDSPAIFLTITSNSFSSLAAKFHPESRWVNITGQTDLWPERPEYPRFRELLGSPLPRYVLAPALQQGGRPLAQPHRAAWEVIDRALAAQGLETSGRTCHLVETGLWPHGVPTQATTSGAFWICPVRGGSPALLEADPQDRVRAMDDVFERMEAHCPRFLVPGGAQTKRYADHWTRYYTASDTRVYVEDAGVVTYKYFRAFSPSVAGSIDDVRQGRIKLDCNKLPGRYLAPWARG